jgi:creatinine amidohydrolase
MSKWEIPASGGNMESANGIYYQNMTNLEVAERLKKNDVLLLPVGSTENQGPSAPYGEDTYLDTRLCEQVAKATGCTVAQPIWYGSHPYHHLGQKGTIMIPEETSRLSRICFRRFLEHGLSKDHRRQRPWPGLCHSSRHPQIRKEVPGSLNHSLYAFLELREGRTGYQGKTAGLRYPVIHADEVEQSWSLRCSLSFANSNMP